MSLLLEFFLLRAIVRGDWHPAQAEVPLLLVGHPAVAGASLHNVSDYLGSPGKEMKLMVSDYYKICIDPCVNKNRNCV